MSRLRKRSRQAWTLLLMLLLVTCWGPPLRVRQVDNAVIIDVATLGDYPATISRLKIKNQSNDVVVWEVRASTDLAEIRSIELSLGSNSNQPPEALHGEYYVVQPSDADSFLLEPGIAYAFEVWGTGRWPARAEITLQPVNR